MVDDESSILDLLTLILEGQGFTVLPAYGFKHGKTIIEERHSEITCLLTDTQLGDGLGTSLIRLFKEKQPTRHAIRTSGNPICKDASAGETIFLAKPFSTNELVEKIKEFCIN